ncbi:MAG: glycosyltransferase family 9 protein, partial [Bacteroidales bacterium]
KIFFKYICGIHQIVGLKESHTNLVRRKSNGYLVKSLKDSEKFIRIVERYHNVKFERPQGCLLPINNKVVSSVDNILKNVQNEISKTSNIVCMGIGTKMPAKKWFLERYTEIANRLIEQKNVFLIFLGSKEESNEIESLIANLHQKNRVLNLAGKTSVIESAEILRRCSLYFGNDTGTMHLAATVGTKCVTIFSSRGIIGRYEPYGNGHINIIKRINCEGCYLEVCVEKNMECLRQIEVEEVWNQLDKII